MTAAAGRLYPNCPCAFTLIELLVAIATTAILAALLLEPRPQFEARQLKVVIEAENGPNAFAPH